MENRSKLQKIKSACIILGTLIYFTRLIREDLQGHETILYWLGFIPNFGMSFAFPFSFFSKKHILCELRVEKRFPEVTKSNKFEYSTT
jgi:hypothetical protein